MTIRHLKIFVEVAESGTMSAAAERCFISQPTVSQVIRELEEHYQVRLFERLSKKLYITESGERLLTSARKVLEQFNLLETNMESSRAEEYLRIGATITVGACLLSSILNDMKQLACAAPFFTHNEVVLREFFYADLLFSGEGMSVGDCEYEKVIDDRDADQVRV